MSKQGQGENDGGIRYNKNIERIVREYEKNPWASEYEFADIDPFYRDRISYETLFFEQHPFLRFREDEVFEGMFYTMVNGANRMIHAIYSGKPPLDGVIEALEERFRERMTGKDGVGQEQVYGFIAYMADAILKRLGYVKSSKIGKLSKGQSIRAQSLYTIGEVE